MQFANAFFILYVFQFVVWFKFPLQQQLLLLNKLFKHPVVVDSSAKSNNNWVVDMVLLFTSKNKSAISTKLLEFIFLPPILQNMRKKLFLRQTLANFIKKLVI